MLLWIRHLASIFVLGRFALIWRTQGQYYAIRGDLAPEDLQPIVAQFAEKLSEETNLSKLEKRP